MSKFDRASFVEMYSKQTDTHIYFWGGSLANYFDTRFTWNKREFKSVAQAYAYAKAVTFDKSYIPIILEQVSARRAEELGREIPAFDEEVWSEKRYKVMYDLLKTKFTNDEWLTHELLSTEDKILVYGVEEDKIWGAGLGFYTNKILDESNWVGENLLGKALMELRDELKGENKNE